MKKLYTFLLIIMILLLTNGCSPVIPKYRVAIDAISAPQVNRIEKIYTIQPLGKNTDINSLKFQEQIAVLDEVLTQQNYRKTTSPAFAKQIIYFDYGIETVKQETEVYQRPSMSMSIGLGFGHYHGYGHPYGFYGHPFGFHHYDTFWYEGYRGYTRTTTFYNRYVTLLSKDPMGKELWRVDVASVGESKNLRKIVPLLIRGASPYFGKNTKETIKIVIKDRVQKRE
jgi:hypothetical protein